MIGNDVVDLRDAEARPGASHPRFDRRVFTAEERRRIAAAGPDAPLRWMLWASKEAAFKVARRRDPACVFAPIRFQPELDSAGLGRVRHAGLDYGLRVTRLGDCVHAVAAEPGRSLRAVKARVRPAPETRGSATAEASAWVRAFALADLANELGVDVATLAIHSHRRIPHLVIGGVGAVALSLSHHGRYVAWAWASPLPEAAS